jgi:hypothetical protein
MAHERVTTSVRIASFTPAEPHMAVVSDEVVRTQLGCFHDDDDPHFMVESGEPVMVVGWAMFGSETDIQYSKRRGYPVVIARGRYGWLYSEEIEEP